MFKWQHGASLIRKYAEASSSENSADVQSNVVAGGAVSSEFKFSDEFFLTTFHFVSKRHRNRFKCELGAKMSLYAELDLLKAKLAHERLRCAKELELDRSSTVVDRANECCTRYGQLTRSSDTVVTAVNESSAIERLTEKCVLLEAEVNLLKSDFNSTVTAKQSVEEQLTAANTVIHHLRNELNAQLGKQLCSATAIGKDANQLQSPESCSDSNINSVLLVKDSRSILGAFEKEEDEEELVVVEDVRDESEDQQIAETATSAVDNNSNSPCGALQTNEAASRATSGPSNLGVRSARRKFEMPSVARMRTDLVRFFETTLSSVQWLAWNSFCNLARRDSNAALIRRRMLFHGLNGRFYRSVRGDFLKQRTTSVRVLTAARQSTTSCGAPVRIISAKSNDAVFSQPNLTTGDSTYEKEQQQHTAEAAVEECETSIAFNLSST
jgi:hypothetical protein